MTSAWKPVFSLSFVDFSGSEDFCHLLSQKCQKHRGAWGSLANTRTGQSIARLFVITFPGARLPRSRR